MAVQVDSTHAVSYVIATLVAMAFVLCAIPGLTTEWGKFPWEKWWDLPEFFLGFFVGIAKKTYCCLVGNGWEWGNGIIIDSYCGSFPHSLLSTSKITRWFTAFHSSHPLFLRTSKVISAPGHRVTAPSWSYASRWEKIYEFNNDYLVTISNQ